MKSKRGATTPASSARPAQRIGASVLYGASSPSIHGGEISNSERDQIRSTIIINVGGSDSDASRATSAVQKGNTAESAGGSPYASTSSTSDQQESSVLEESSLGKCDASFEVEEVQSPPTGENTIEEEHSNSIYERHMYLKKHGFPLWIPQPNLRLSCSYRRRGVSIGDVGIFTAGGGFDFLFNICLSAGHPSNPDELPEGFCRLKLKPADVCEFRAHTSNSYIASSSVKKQGTTFQCSDSDGALLVMPQGAHDEDLRNISRFRDYASLHAESWYQYAKGTCGREIDNAELHLVTGCDKTTSWGVAAYSHAQSKRVEDDETLLNFNVRSELEARHSLSPAFVWYQQGAADVKAGPEDDELMDLPEVHAVRPLRNQCTFIRSLTLALGDADWERLQAKVATSADDRKSARSPENPLPSVFGAVISLSGLISSFRGDSRESTSKLIGSVSPEQIISAHPATYVVDMLLQKCPKAKVVVVHDSDWCSVIRNSDDDWMSTVQDLPHRIQEAFHIVEEENGTVYLEEKTRPSQDLSTSSDVAVNVEVEDRPNDDDGWDGSSLPLLLPSAMDLFSKAVAEQRGSHLPEAPALSTAKTPGKLESFFNRSRRTNNGIFPAGGDNFNRRRQFQPGEVNSEESPGTQTTSPYNPMAQATVAPNIQVYTGASMPVYGANSPLTQAPIRGAFPVDEQQPRKSPGTMSAQAAHREKQYNLDGPSPASKCIKISGETELYCQWGDCSEGPMTEAEIFQHFQAHGDTVKDWNGRVKECKWLGCDPKPGLFPMTSNNFRRHVYETRSHAVIGGLTTVKCESCGVKRSRRSMPNHRRMCSRESKEPKGKKRQD